MLLADPGIVWYCSCEPFLFDIIEFFADPNIPGSKRLFTLIYNYFNQLFCVLVVFASTPKLEAVILVCGIGRMKITAGTFAIKKIGLAGILGLLLNLGLPEEKELFFSIFGVLH